MYSLSFLIVELETARTTLLDVFGVSNGTPNTSAQKTHFKKSDLRKSSQIDEYEKEIAH